MAEVSACKIEKQIVLRIIKDEKGNVIESGEAFPRPDDPDIWDYLTTASFPSGTSVIVCVVAIDRLGGVGERSE